VFPTESGDDVASSLASAVRGLSIPTSQATIRAASAQLGAALAAAGRWRDAVAAYDTAVAEPGDDPPEVDVRLARASCSLQLGGDRSKAYVDVLSWLATEPPGWQPVAELVLLALAAEEAATLRPWVINAWLPAMTARGGDLRATASVIAAGLHALAGKGTAVVDALRAATALDAPLARRLWDRWIETAGSPTGALNAVPGGAAFTTTLRARAEYALGDTAAAAALADSVIDDRLTGEGYPELEAYWLRSELPGRTAEQRASDLVATGIRLMWRGAKPDLDAAIGVFDEARALDPDNRDSCWNKAEARRLRSRGSTTPDIAELRTAWAEWDDGRRLGPVGDSWAWFVRGQLASELGDAVPREAANWALEVLTSAAECVSADPTWRPGWAFLADALRRARLWTATEWAALTTLQVDPEWSAGAQYEAVTVARALLLAAPRTYRQRKDIFAEPFGALGQAAELFDVLAALMLEPDQPIDDGAVVRALGGDDVTDRVSRARLLLLAGSDAAADAVAAAHEAVDRNADDRLRVIGDYASLLVADGRPIDDHMRRELADPALWLSPSNVAGFDLTNAVLAGDAGAAESAFVASTRGASAADALFTAREFDHLASVLDRRNQPERAELARSFAARLRAADPAEQREPASVWLALAELDARAADAPAAWRPAIAAARAFVASRVRPGEIASTVAATEFAATPGIVELSEQLIPVDAVTNWRDWVMFTSLVPTLHAELSEVLGFPTVGVTVRPAADLPPRGYRVLVDGLERGRGEVDGDPPDPPLPVAHYTDEQLWREPVAVLQRALIAEPAAAFVPSVIGSLLDAREVPGRAELSAAQQLTMWQALRSTLDTDGHLRAVSAAGLSDVVAALRDQTDDAQPATAVATGSS
jgi:tetratricopeptide (TPR) repeat protein